METATGPSDATRSVTATAKPGVTRCERYAHSNTTRSVHGGVVSLSVIGQTGQRLDTETRQRLVRDWTRHTYSTAAATTEQEGGSEGRGGGVGGALCVLPRSRHIDWDHGHIFNTQ